MAVINKYTAHTIEPDILSRLNVDQAGDVVSAETWVALWELVLHLLAKYNEHFVDIYRTLEELGTEVDTCIKRIDSLEDQYQSLEERMGNLETSWSALQDAYNKVAGHYEEIKHIQESLESGFVHYGKEPPATDFIKLWVMPTQGIPSLITSWGENDILATNYNYASAKLIKDSLNTKVNKAGDTMTGPLNFNCLNTYALYGGNPAYREWYVNWDGDFKLWTGSVSELDVGSRLRVGGTQGSFTIITGGSDPSVTLHNLRLTGLKHPTMSDDAASKQYVDSTRDLNTVPSNVINDWEYGRLYKTWLLDANMAAVLLQYRTASGDVVNLPKEAQSVIGLAFKSKETMMHVESDGTSYETYNIIITLFNGEACCVVSIDPTTNIITVKDCLKPARPDNKGIYKDELLEPSHYVYPTTALVKEYIDTYSDLAEIGSENILDWTPSKLYKINALAGSKMCCGDYTSNISYVEGLATVLKRTTSEQESTFTFCSITYLGSQVGVYRVDNTGHVLEVVQEVYRTLSQNVDDNNSFTYPSTKAVKEYVDPKIADLEENKFRHTGYYETLNTVVVDTPDNTATYAMPYSLGLIEGTTYTVGYVTASGTTGQLNLVATTNADWGIPAGALVLTDSEETPNVIIIDCCNSDWLFNANSSLFYSDSTAMADDPIIRITVYGVNAKVFTHNKLPEECLDISDEFIDGHKLTKATVPLNRLKGPELLETVEIPEGEVVDAVSISLTGVNKDYARYRCVGHLQCAPATDDITGIHISLKSGLAVYQNIMFTLSEYDRTLSWLDVCFDLDIEKEDELATITLNGRTNGSGAYLTKRIIKNVSRFVSTITLSGPFKKSNLSPELRCYGYNKLTE